MKLSIDTRAADSFRGSPLAPKTPIPLFYVNLLISLLIHLSYPKYFNIEITRFYHDSHAEAKMHPVSESLR